MAKSNVSSKSSRSSVSASSFWKSISFVLAILVLAQWVLFLFVLDGQRNNAVNQDSSSCGVTAQTVSASSTNSALVDGSSSTSYSSRNITISTVTDGSRLQRIKKEDKQENDNIDEKQNFEGIAATVMLKAPKWFHRRYTTMIHNVMVNIPSTWGIQIFYNSDWLSRDVLPLHPGLQTMFANPGKRIIWTELPKTMARQKPKQVMKSTWLWESLEAENVLFFSGNGALCGNSIPSLSRFIPFDYVGAPWKQHSGLGGDGSTHSFRHKSAMLRILQESPPGTDDLQDHVYFVKAMVQSNKNNKNNPHYKLADRNTTLSFGGIESISGTTVGYGGNLEMHAPLLLSGTQASLNWTIREGLLGVCPEVKMIFPSMHEPACFGAHPNPTECRATICALQDPIPGHGC